MNTINTKYCQHDLQFEEKAHQQFEAYEKRLKEYFLNQHDGLEIFEDLKLRLCEMLYAKMKNRGGSITQEDIADIIKSIGEVEQLEQDDMLEDVDYTSGGTNPKQRKKLYRSEREKIIAGVCGGLGNYFSIDPIAFRLLFVIITVMSRGLGLLTYIILWVVLTSKELPENLSKRLYRNSNNKVIAGVCGGLASFFNIEAWILRVIFLSPIILNAAFSGFFDIGITIFNGSAMGVVLITYIILWITTKETETPSEELLARGEEVNISSITEETKRAHATPSGNSGLNNLLRVLAFIVIGLSMVPIIALLFSLVFGSLFMLPLTSAVLHTALMKWLGVLSVIFFLLLPLVAMIVWGIRRIAGIKGPNKKLRTTFGALWGLGFTSATVLSFLLVSELHSSATVSEKIQIPFAGDTLYVDALKEEVSGTKVTFANSFLSNFYENENGMQHSRLINIKQRVSPDSTFYFEVKKSAQGKGKKAAAANANLAKLEYAILNNHISVSEFISLSNKEPFRFQHAEIIFYVPQDKVLIIDPELKNVRFGNKHIKFNTEWDELDTETKAEIQQDVNEAIDELNKAMDEVSDGLNEVSEELDDINVDNGQGKQTTAAEIKKATEQTRAKIRLEKQKLRLKKEQLKLEQLQQELDAAD